MNLSKKKLPNTIKRKYQMNQSKTLKIIIKFNYVAKSGSLRI